MEEAKRQELDELLADSPYRVVSELGLGKFAEVYVVQQTFLRKRFALKLIRPHWVEDPEYVERFRREARSLGRIESTHVVRVVDLGTARNGAPFLVMEFMEGRSLADELRDRHSLPPGEALTWASQALVGLQAAHALGLVHRDVTPGNLFLQEVPGYPRICKVMDFGLARVLPHVGDSAVRGAGGLTTSTGAIIGSPAYASPEALRGERVDARCDLFGVGLILFQMLTGIYPLQLVGMTVPAPSEYDGSIPDAIDAIVLRATRVAPEDRYESAGAFLADLKTVEH